MPLPFDLHLEFDVAERELGDELVQTGKVRLTDPGTNGAYEAEVVHFSRHYWVWIRSRFDRSVQGHGCDCSHFENTGKGCEHLWAMLRTLLGDSEEAGDSATLEPRYLLHRGLSEREARPVLSIHDPDGRPLSMTHATWRRIEGDADIDAIRLLGDKSGGWAPVRSGGGLAQKDGPWRPALDATEEVIKALLQTGRLYVGNAAADCHSPLALGVGSTLDVCVWVEAVGTAEAELRGRVLDIDGATGEFDIERLDTVVAGPWPFVVFSGRVWPLRHWGARDWLRRWRQGPPRRLAAERVESVLEELGRDGPLPRVRLPTDDRPLTIVPMTPRGRVAILRKGSSSVLRLAYTYGPRLVVSPQATATLLFDKAARRQTPRDPIAEERILADLLELGADPDVEAADTFYLPTAKLLQTVDALAAKGFALLLDDKKTSRPGRLTLSLSGHRDWFEIEGALETDGQSASLLAVLASLKSGKDFVELADGSTVLIAEADRRRLERLLPFVDFANPAAQGVVAMPQSRALLVEAIMGPAVKKDAAFETLRRRLEDFGGIRVQADPRGLQGRLRPYQRDGLSWLAFLEETGLGGCLADEMGLGKTVQVIAGLLSRRAIGASGPHLVVVPRSLVANWQSELLRFAPDLEVETHSGASRQVGPWRSGTVVITTYGILRRDAETLRTVPFDWLILDEAQNIKNASSLSAQAARSLTGRRRIAMTGTPLENSAAELWSILDFANPGLFGGADAFTGLAEEGDDAARAALRAAMRPVMLRRTKDMVAKDLPPLVEQVVLTDMTDEQQKTYDRIRRAAAAQVQGAGAGARDSAHVLEALLRLRQVACHGNLVQEDGGGSGKLELLVDRLEELRASGRKALVFSQFTRLLGMVKKELDLVRVKYAYLDGSTVDRTSPVRIFQDDPRCTAFLISLRAGGTGLNLTAADHVFILDPWWNPAVEAQAIARAHRIGRTSTVIAHRLVARGTVEEAMLELQARKKELAGALTAEGGDLEGISGDDLASLLRFGS